MYIKTEIHLKEQSWMLPIGDTFSTLKNSTVFFCNWPIFIYVYIFMHGHLYKQEIKNDLVINEIYTYVHLYL